MVASTTERPGHARDAVDALRPVHQHFFCGRLIVGDDLERDVRHDAADFFALADSACACRRSRRPDRGFVFQFVPGKGRGQQALASQGERHTAGINGDPAPAPLLGDVGRRAAAAGRVEHEVAGVGGHEDAPLR